MRPTIVPLIVAGLLALGAGCVESTTPTNASTTCTMTITGASVVAGTYVCAYAPTSLYLPSTGLTSFSVIVNGAKSVLGAVLFSGVPSTSPVYSAESSSGLPPYSFFVNTGMGAWRFTAGGQPASRLGAFTLKFSSVGPAAPTSTGSSTYVTHGILDATLVPEPGSGATGNATMHIEF